MPQQAPLPSSSSEAAGAMTGTRTPQPPTPTSGGRAKKTVRLRFLFASHEGVTLELPRALPLDTKVGEVKRLLREAWPPAAIPPVASPSTLSSSSASGITTTTSGIASYAEGEPTPPPSPRSGGMGVFASTASSSSAAACPEPPEAQRIRLICMGQGLNNDGKTLQDCHVPVFDAHPTSINVSVRPAQGAGEGGGAQGKRPKTLDGEDAAEDGGQGLAPRCAGFCAVM